MYIFIWFKTVMESSAIFGSKKANTLVLTLTKVIRHNSADIVPSSNRRRVTDRTEDYQMWHKQVFIKESYLLLRIFIFNNTHECKMIFYHKSLRFILSFLHFRSNKFKKKINFLLTSNYDKNVSPLKMNDLSNVISSTNMVKENRFIRIKYNVSNSFW